MVRPEIGVTGSLFQLLHSFARQQFKAVEILEQRKLVDICLILVVCSRNRTRIYELNGTAEILL